MHIYMYLVIIQTLQAFIKYTNIDYSAIIEQSPCFLLFSFSVPFCSPFVSLYLLGTLFAVIGSSPPRSQVARKLISPFPSPCPYTPHSKIPTPWGGRPDPNIHITKTTSRNWLTRSSTIPFLPLHSPVSKQLPSPWSGTGG